MGLNKIETPLGNFSLRKSESVNIIDSTKIPSEYVNVVIENKPDKVKIKDAIKK